jgi:hypothetical protein
MKTAITLSFIFHLLSGMQTQAQESSLQPIVHTDTLELSGSYTGSDLYIQNPIASINKDTVWTAQEVYVNGNLILSADQLRSPAFAIPLTRLNLAQGDKLHIQIRQHKGNRVKVLQGMTCGHN